MINNGIRDVARASSLLEEASKSFGLSDLLGALVPPKHFDSAEFTTYRPEPGFPSQHHALESVKAFTESIGRNPRGSVFGRIFAGRNTTGRGLYLDGGFGVGKTHLLASAFHAYHGRKAYLSFQELMFLVGLETLQGVVESFKNHSLLVVDELELDDPANTRITTNLLGQLLDGGVSILTSSNTPPGALGEGKFSVEDFKRELGALTSRFAAVRIDGEDYRMVHHIGEGTASTWLSTDLEVDGAVSSDNHLLNNVLDESFKLVLDALGRVHPMRIRRALGKYQGIILRNVEPINHPHEALRFVYFVDKAYDNNISLFASSSVKPRDLFPSHYFHGGDTKKYLRTVSRLTEMARA